MCLGVCDPCALHCSQAQQLKQMVANKLYKSAHSLLIKKASLVFRDHLLLSDYEVQLSIVCVRECARACCVWMGRRACECAYVFDRIVECA